MRSRCESSRGVLRAALGVAALSLGACATPATIDPVVVDATPDASDVAADRAAPPSDALDAIIRTDVPAEFDVASPRDVTSPRDAPAMHDGGTPALSASTYHVGVTYTSDGPATGGAAFPALMVNNRARRPRPTSTC